MNLWTNRDFGPQLLKEVNKPFNNKDYLYEIKFDGIRALIFVNKNDIKIISRNKTDLTFLYPELLSIKKLVNKNTIFDGEIVLFNDDKPSFSKLSERSHLKNIDKIKQISKENPVIFVCFDILYYGKDITSLPLEKRKQVLNKFKESAYFFISKIYDDGIMLFEKVKKLGLEGIIAKKKDSSYEISTRNFSWIKIKNYKIESFLISGYVNMKNGYISVILSEEKNKKRYFVGKASLSGNNNLYKKILNSKKTNVNNVINYDEKNAIFLKDKIYCTVKYIERTNKNHLRQPIIDKESKHG